MPYTKVSNEEFLSYMARYQESVGRPLKKAEIKSLNSVHFYNGADKRYINTLSKPNHAIHVPSCLFACRDGEFEILTKLYEDYKEE